MFPETIRDTFYAKDLNLPIAKTGEIGHGNLSKGLIIGKRIYLDINSNIFIYSSKTK